MLLPGLDIVRVAEVDMRRCGWVMVGKGGGLIVQVVVLGER